MCVWCGVCLTIHQCTNMIQLKYAPNMNRTYFPDANETVRLEFGEFLIHPGNLVHGGVDITQGKRYLMIMFTHTES